MTARVTRSKKRKIQEKLTDLNFYEDGMNMDEMEQLNQILETPTKSPKNQTVRGRKRKIKSDSGESWDRAAIIELKTHQMVSPDSSPTYYRKIFVTAIVHHEEHDSPKPSDMPLTPRSLSERSESPTTDTDISQPKEFIDRREQITINLDEIFSCPE